jgi:hypothetical protein
MINDSAIEQARAISIMEVAERYGLRLRKNGRDFVGPCPLCGGEDRFALHPTRGWLCRGCNLDGGDAIALVRHLEGGCGFAEAVTILVGERAVSGAAYHPVAAARERTRRAAEEHAEREASARKALKQFDEASRDLGPAMVWLRDVRKLRGFERLIGPTLRFHPEVPWLDEGDTLTRHPALLALMRDVVTDRPVAVHRTALSPDGRTKIGRKMRGPTRGAAIKIERRWSNRETLAVAEGLESALAGRQLGMRRIWAMGSTGSIAKLPVLDGVTRLILCRENDENGASAKACAECGDRWRQAGREVQIVQPPPHLSDLNDLVMEEAGR